MRLPPVRTSARLLNGAFLLLVLGHQAAAAQSTQAPPLVRAQQAIARQDYATAIALLRELVAATPGNGTAWNMLGVAHRRSGQWRDALPMHARAAEIDATRALSMYQTGLAYAAGGELDSAFQWLQKAKATGRVDMTNVGLDPLAPALQKDARYRGLLPSAEEYAAPFVEPTRILHEWRGEAAGDQFGWIARNIGDADGDGIADAVTSAPTHDNSVGKVYVYSGRSGRLLWSARGPTPGALLGMGVEAAGDVDGDGRGDAIAGAPGADRAFVYSGSDGRLLHTLSGEAQGDRFGARVARAGDLNLDGLGDVLVSAPNHDGPEGADAGRVYAFSGKDGSLLWKVDGEAAGDFLGTALAGNLVAGQNWIVIGAGTAGPNRNGRVYAYRGPTPELAFRIDGDSTSTALGGMFVSVVGDVDADGTPDIYGSDWSNAAKGAATGRIYVHSGASGARLHTLTGEASGDGFGIGPADAGDVDRDGHADLIIGAWQHASAALSGGKTYLFSGKTGALLRAWTGRVQGETFGFDATGIGDVDGDGEIDFLLTSAWSSINGARSGRVFIISGK